MEENERKAKLYYTKDTFVPKYVQVGNNWISLSDSPLAFFDADRPDPATKELKEKEFTYIKPDDYNDTLKIIAAAARAKAEELRLAAEEEEEEDEEDVVKVPVAAVADPVAAKRTSSSGYNIYNYLTGSTEAKTTAARVDQAVGKKGYKLADDGKSLVRGFDNRTIKINENGGMQAPAITTGSPAKVASMLANDLIVMLRTYAILYQKGGDAALPDGIINLRINHQGLSIDQELAQILLIKDVKERFYAEMTEENNKKTEGKPKPYPDAFLKKFKFNGDEIHLDLKRKADTAPDTTPDAKKPAPAPAATSDYLKAVITSLEKGIANPDDAKPIILTSILDGSNTVLAAEGNVVKPTTPPASAEENAALQKTLGLLQEALSKYGYEKTTVQVNADSMTMTLPKPGKDMAAEINTGVAKAATPGAPPSLSPRR